MTYQIKCLLHIQKKHKKSECSAHPSVYTTFLSVLFMLQDVKESIRATNPLGFIVKLFGPISHVVRQKIFRFNIGERDKGTWLIVITWYTMQGTNFQVFVKIACFR